MRLFLLAKAVCMPRQGITDNIVWMGSWPHCHEVLACCVFQAACDYIYFNTSDVTVLLASGSTPPCWPPDPLYPMLWKLPLCSHFDPVTPAPECHVAGMVLSPLPLPQHSHRTCCCSFLNWRSPHPPPPSFCHLLGSSLKKSILRFNLTLLKPCFPWESLPRESGDSSEPMALPSACYFHPLLNL